MTDAYMRINSHGQEEGTSITTAGRVVINTRLDEREILARKEASARDQALYNGPVEDDSFRVLPGEIVFEEKDHGRTSIVTSDGSLVLSTLNGAFSKGESLSVITDRLDYRGVAGSEGGRYDSTGRNPHVHFPALIGGLTTMTNTGKKQIRNGDRIFWSLPDPKDINEMDIRNGGRKVLQTNPYDPRADTLTIETMRAYMSTSAAALQGNPDVDLRAPLVQGAETMKQAWLQLFLEALHVFMMTGIVKYDPNILTNAEERRKNINEYQSTGGAKERKTFLSNIALQLGIKNVYALGDIRPKNLQVDGESLEQIASSVMVGLKMSSMLFKPVDDADLKGNEKILVRNQSAVLSKILNSVDRARHFTLRRIFATAVSSAAPGQKMDVLLRSGIM